MKPTVSESRYDFRGGRNTAISPDLLNTNELVDATNARLSQTYGGFTKRSGTQRINKTAFPAAIRGVTQWDGPNGKQTVVISNGQLYFRDGFDLTAGFTAAQTTALLRTTAHLGTEAAGTGGGPGERGWVDPHTGVDDSTDDGKNIITLGGAAPQNVTHTYVAADRLQIRLGDPTVGSNVNATDDLYTFSYLLKVDTTGMIGVLGFFTATVSFEYSTDGGGTYTSTAGGNGITIGPGTTSTQTFNPTVQIPGAPTQVWIRPILKYTVNYTDDPNFPGVGTGNSTATLQCFATVYKTDNFVTTWTTGTGQFSTTEPTFFAPFRAAASGAPLTLYLASGNHYFSWDGLGNSNSLLQLDGIANAPAASNIISYHTRMFAMSASPSLPGLTPKTIYWSKIGDATAFTPGDKSQGGSAVTDFLTGQQLVALEVIGSSLLMTTNDSVMRFTGHASDDIVISQDTEGISAEVGAVGPQALKRYENVAAMYSERGPYAVTETFAQPMGEQLNPDWTALDQANLSKISVEYNRSRKELYFAVPGASDGGSPKTLFVQSVRLQAWQGPWTYPFTINCMCKYVEADGSFNVLAGSNDGFVRLMDVGKLDDVLYDGTGGSNITMTVELPVLHFGSPGLKKALKWMLLQANLPLTCAPIVRISFDGGSFSDFPITPLNLGEEDYRVDVTGQGFRCRMQFVDSSADTLTIHGFTLVGWNYQRTT